MISGRANKLAAIDALYSDVSWAHLHPVVYKIAEEPIPKSLLKVIKIDGCSFSIFTE